jgi:hypothetical protein
MYLNTITGNVYTNINTVWTLSSNLTGPQGLVGPTGPSGINGTTGINGTIGPQGLVGPTGPAGADSTVIGPTGPTGIGFVLVPSTTNGNSGDTVGMMAVDAINGYLYYCIATYTDGSTAIWYRQTLAGTTW